MTKVKICGLSRDIDIDYVNNLKPEYIGFVFAKSKRQVSLEQAKILAAKLSGSIKTVGVFVNENKEKVQLIAESLKLDVLQFHGDESVDYIKYFSNYECWKSIRVSGSDDLKKIQQYDRSTTILLDGKIPGSGIAFDWNIIKDLTLKRKLILAGGLSPDNISEAIMSVKPYAVDVSSGVETNGMKDIVKIEDFIRKVRCI